MKTVLSMLFVKVLGFSDVNKDSFATLLQLLSLPAATIDDVSTSVDAKTHLKLGQCEL